MIARCWPKLPLSSTTRVTSGRLANCSRKSAAERSRLPSFTKMTSYDMPSPSSAGYRRAKSEPSPSSSLYTGMTTDRSINWGRTLFFSFDNLSRRSAHAIDVGVRHRREERQRRDGAADALGVRELARAPAELAIEREEMHRRIVHADADAVVAHAGDEARALDLARQHDLEHVPVALRV